MLHPSYTDLIEVANKNVAEGDQPVVSSRYSVILAAARRARQLVEGADPLVHGNERKPLSVAIDELAEDQIHILPYGSEDTEIREEIGAEAIEAWEEPAGYGDETPEPEVSGEVDEEEVTDESEHEAAGFREEAEEAEDGEPEEASAEEETEEE